MARRSYFDFRRQAAYAQYERLLKVTRHPERSDVEG